MKNFDNPYSRFTNKGTVSQTWPGFSEFLLTKKFTKIIQQVSYFEILGSIDNLAIFDQSSSTTFTELLEHTLFPCLVRFC